MSIRTAKYRKIMGTTIKGTAKKPIDARGVVEDEREGKKIIRKMIMKMIANTKRNTPTSRSPNGAAISKCCESCSLIFIDIDLPCIRKANEYQLERAPATAIKAVPVPFFHPFSLRTRYFNYSMVISCWDLSITLVYDIVKTLKGDELCEEQGEVEGPVDHPIMIQTTP
ncbi:hypothetical protein ACFLVX_02030 [Chloroflexota bacterium]